MSTTLSDLMLNDRGFAFDPASGETYQLSATALRIVRLLQQGIHLDAILRHLTEEFDADPHTLARDFADFLHSMEQIGWTRP